MKLTRDLRFLLAVFLAAACAIYTGSAYSDTRKSNIWFSADYIYIHAECTVESQSPGDDNMLESNANCTIYMPYSPGKRDNYTEQGNPILYGDKDDNPYNIGDTYDAKALYDTLEDVVLYVVWLETEITYCPASRKRGAPLILAYFIISLGVLIVLSAMWGCYMIESFNEQSINNSLPKYQSVP